MSVRLNPVLSLPREINLQIFSYLSPFELGRCYRVSKAWKELASADALWKALHPTLAFGKKKWETYYGDVGEEPSLPRKIHQILNSPCPFWGGKRVEETHLLVLIPKTVNGEPLTLRSLGELVKTPKGGGHATQYRYFWKKAMEQLGDQPVEGSYWILMTKDIAPHSRNETLGKHQARLQKYPSYEMPRAIEASAALFSEYVVSQTRLYSDRPFTYTRCQERIDKWSLAVGGFAVGGPAVDDDGWYASCSGVGGCRKF